ncbi:cupredoxin domain-containing protein [Candidatus Woesearchaeota archaeon]|nr:cupredoxin domain-containing protein [Candidatus Woesearchaeota archaeon]
MKLIKTAVILFMLLFVAISASCANSATETTQATQPAPAAQPIQTVEVPTAQAEKTTQDIEESIPIKTDESKKTGELKEFQVSAFRYGFSPDPIVVNKGDKVRLVVKSEDVKHGLAIPDFGVDAEIIPGKTTTVEFLADKQGEFTIFCSVFCGTGHSTMKGSIVVK